MVDTFLLKYGLASIFNNDGYHVISDDDSNNIGGKHTPLPPDKKKEYEDYKSEM